MMSESEIRAFVNEVTTGTGDGMTVAERITARWLQDREDAADEARDAIYDDARDGWNSEETP